jgi:hypothetical protein
MLNPQRKPRKEVITIILTFVSSLIFKIPSQDPFPLNTMIKTGLKLLIMSTYLFRCRNCHEYGYLFKDCPLNSTRKVENPEASKSKDGFTHVVGRCHQVTRKMETNATKDPPFNNSFDVLQQIPYEMDVSQIPP